MQVNLVKKYKHMRNPFILLLLLFTTETTFAQFQNESKDTSWKKEYRASETKINSVVHTKLDVKFNFDSATMNGNEWITLQPTFYPTDSVRLDAKGMTIKEVSLFNAGIKTKLKYDYDGMQLNIKLNKTYKGGEKYTLYFEYISRPNELESEGSAAITDAKGLYFINPTGEDKNKPTQIWTQGETESNSAWMITIDKPNQKSTEEITMTVPDKYVTLSNGLLISQKKNANGTRSDYWKMDLPHAPYLFFMGVGDFAIVKDTYKGKEVSYYVEKKQQPYARGVFGNTPEMMDFFSKKLNVEYPWPKYAQIVGRDFVSGAMENTSATLHQESAYQNARELTEGNDWEETIAHELFHHWFGDLVTAESWSNLTVNESFANYSEYLWDEYKYGKDFADAHNFEDMQGYLMSGSDKKDLARFHYASREDMFDAVSYNKGGRILHMLRNVVGDEAFFKSLNNYLTTNKFKTGEAHQLRLAFEEVTGRDLNWFWNQWYYGSGHPKLKISYNFDSSKNISSVIIDQVQKSGKAFILPMAVDIYVDGKATRQLITAKNLSDTFTFNVSKMPDWISVDADKILLAEKTDSKTEANYLAQWKFGKNYLDRKEALDYFAKNNLAQLSEGLNDKFFKLRLNTIQKLGTSGFKGDVAIINQIERMATKDANKKVKAAAINFLVKNGDKKYLSLYEAAIKDSSYAVAGAAFKGINAINPEGAFELAKKYSNDVKGAFGDEVNKIILTQGTEADFDFIANRYSDAPLSQEKISTTDKFAVYLSKLNDITKVKAGIDKILAFRKSIPSQYLSFIDPSISKALGKISKAKGEEIEKYIEEKLK